MSKIYAVIEGIRVLRMSRDKEELITYLNSFPEAERRRMWIVEKSEEIRQIISRWKKERR